MLKKYLVFLSFALMVFTSGSVFAQGGGPPEPAGAPGDCIGCPPANPIDGGIGILFALGIGYAVKKLRKKD